MCSILPDDSSGTAAHGVLFLLSPSCHRVPFLFGESLQNFDQHVFTSSCWSRLLSKGSVSVEMVNLDSSLLEERSWHLFTPIPEQFKPVSHSTKLSRDAAWTASTTDKGSCTSAAVPATFCRATIHHHFERCAMQSHVSTSPSFSITFFVPLCHSGITECSSGPGHDLILFIVCAMGLVVVFNLPVCVVW